MSLTRIAIGVVGITFLMTGYFGLPALSSQTTPDKIQLAQLITYAISAFLFLLAIAFERILAWMDSLEQMIRARYPGKVPIRNDASRLERLVNASFVLVVTILTILVFVSEDVAVSLAREDAVLENATAIFYLIAAVLNVLLLIRMKHLPMLRIHLGILSLLFFVVGMEEISWGQRLFDLKTPEILAQVNVQKEITIHNIWSISLTTYPAIFVTATLLCFLPLLNRYNDRAQRYLSTIQFPVAAFDYAVLYVLMLAAYVTIGIRLGTPTPLPISFGELVPHIDDEYMEFFIAYLFLSASITFWRIDSKRAPNRTAS